MWDPDAEACVAGCPWGMHAADINTCVKGCPEGFLVNQDTGKCEYETYSSEISWRYVAISAIIIPCICIVCIYYQCRKY